MTSLICRTMKSALLLLWLISIPASAVTVTVNFTGQVTGAMQTSYNPQAGEPVGSFTIDADIPLTGSHTVDLDSPGAITAFEMTYGNQNFGLDDLSWPDGTEVHPFVNVPNNTGVSVSFIDGTLEAFMFNIFNGSAYGSLGVSGLASCLPNCLNVGGNGAIGFTEFLANGTGNIDRLNFATLSVAEVPVPAAAWLFGSALGLLGYARNRLGSRR